MADAAWVALSLIHGVGGRTFRALLEKFGTPGGVFEAAAAELRAVKGVGAAIASAVAAADLSATGARIAAWEAEGVRILAWDAPDYPDRLRGLPDAPPTLFVKGCWPLDMRHTAAVVGTRTPSSAAVKSAQRISLALLRHGYTLVSGLALGIDYMAHKSAMASKDGLTLAVLGSGVLNIYPPPHRPFAAEIAARGALICEIRPDGQVNTPALVARNRIIAGLSDALIVVQTDADGGALHAARFAKNYGRRVFVVGDPLGSPAAQRGIDALRAEGAIALPPDIDGDALADMVAPPV